MDKQSYFQGGGGVNEPAPKKKKYKSDPAILVQPHFKEIFFKNYDLYDSPGVDGPAKQGPGSSFYNNIQDHKSVKDFLDKRRKKNKNKYKSDDSYIQDDGSLKRAERRMQLLKIITAIDFPIDEQINEPILGDNSAVFNANPIGGRTDQVLPLQDTEGKGPYELAYGHIQDTPDKIDAINKLLNKYLNPMLNPKEEEIYGLPQGISPLEDQDVPYNTDFDYGQTNVGTNIYEVK